MAAKPAHKVLGVELIESSNMTHTAVTDAVGRTVRYGVGPTWGGLSGGQQAKLHGRNYRRLGQSTYPAAETGD